MKTCSRGTPSFTYCSAQATAAAPAPTKTTFTCAMSFRVSSSALISAAPVMMAVPCWSSWKTGICISEHRGPVGDHRDQVSADGVLVGEVRILRDLQAGLSHSGAVGERKIARGGHRLDRHHLDLSLAPAGVIVERVLTRWAPLSIEGR